MNIELSYRDLKKEMLSDKAKDLLTDFVCIWGMKTGEIVDLNSDDVVMQVLQIARRTDDKRLRSIYLHLRVEFTNLIRSSLTRCDAMLADELMTQISKGYTCRVQNRQIIT